MAGFIKIILHLKYPNFGFETSAKHLSTAHQWCCKGTFLKRLHDDTHDIATIITVPIYSQLGAPHILDICAAVHIKFLFIVFKDGAGNGFWCELLHCNAIKKGGGFFFCNEPSHYAVQQWYILTPS
jgi:hypothetical protein